MTPELIQRTRDLINKHYDKPGDKLDPEGREFLSAILALVAEAERLQAKVAELEEDIAIMRGEDNYYEAER